MTENRPLTLARATTLGSAALAAILVACETPRPEPVAPTKTGSENAAPTVSAQKGDAGDQARGARLLEELRSAALPSQILQSSQQDPLLVVTSANGKVVSASRLGGVTEGTRVPIDALGVEPEAIESVDVIKKSGGLALPDEIRGGVIFVRLKAKGSVADAGDLSMMRTGQKTRIPVAERKPSEGEARQLMPENPLVEIYDASDRVVFSRRIASAARKAPAGSAMGDLPVDPKDIARVDVTKPAGVVRVYLKPGASLRNAK